MMRELREKSEGRKRGREERGEKGENRKMTFV